MVLKNFLFHRVASDQDNLWLAMTTSLFESIIKLLNRRYKVVLLEKFLEEPEAYRKSGPLATVLFDDGCKDNISIAAPILQRYKCPASFYIVTNSIDSGL